MTAELTYDYEIRTLTPDQAAALLGGVPKANPHRRDDVCPAWEPIRVIFDRDGRLLLGSDELEHIIGADQPMDAAIYREPAATEPESADFAPAAENALDPEPKPEPKTVDDSAKSLRRRVIDLLHRDYHGVVGNPNNWAGVALLLAGDGATYEQVERMLANMDVKAEYEWYRLALRVQRRSLLPIPTVGAAVLMHRQAQQASRDEVKAFWAELENGGSALTQSLVGVRREGLAEALSERWDVRRA